MKKEYLKINIERLKLNKKNPKLHKDDLIENSIKEFGYLENILVDENNIIIAGHGRYSALKKLGYKEVDVIKVSGFTEKQKEKYLLLSNKLVELGGWDFDLLKSFDDNLLVDVGFEFNKGIEKLLEVRENLNYYKKYHILISFSLDKMENIKKYINKIKQIKDIEIYESPN